MHAKLQQCPVYFSHVLRAAFAVSQRELSSRLIKGNSPHSLKVGEICNMHGSFTRHGLFLWFIYACVCAHVSTHML